MQAALWNTNGEIKVIDPGYGKSGYMTEGAAPSKGPPRSVCHSVMAMTVDGIMRRYHLKKIDILKIDIEGAEKEVFSDTSSWIDNVRSLIIELHERGKPGCNRAFYCGTNGFDREWTRGENVYLARGNYLTMVS